MAFEILNEAASVVYVLAGENRYPQAEPDKVDFDILAQGINEEGVVSGAAVTPQGAPDTTVAVAACVVRIAGTDVAFAGGNVNCGAAHAALPRFDLIIINAGGAAVAVNGVAAAVPVFPGAAAVPGTSVVIAAVWRAANDNTITAADIVDKRVDLLSATFGTAPTLLAIDGAGIADPDRFHHTLAANAGVADDLNGLTVTSIIANGEPLIIRPDAGDAITVKHNALGGADARNILCIGNADIVLDDDHDFAICIYSTAIGAGSWMVLGGGGAGGGHVIENEGAPLAARANLNFTGGLVDAADNAPDTDVHIGKQPDRTDLFITANVTPFLTILKQTRISDNVGIKTNPIAQDALKVIHTGLHAVSRFIIEASTAAFTLGGVFLIFRGVFGQPIISIFAGSTNIIVEGLNFSTFVATGGLGTVVSEQTGARVGCQIFAYTGLITTVRGVYITSPTFTIGNPIVTTAVGIDILNQGAPQITDAFGLRIANVVSATAINRLLELGLNPELRLESGNPPNSGSPVIGDSQLYLAWMENGAVNLRQVRWVDSGALGGAAIPANTKLLYAV